MSYVWRSKRKKCLVSSSLSSTQGFAGFCWFLDVVDRRKWKHFRGDCWRSSFSGLKKDIKTNFSNPLIRKREFQRWEQGAFSLFVSLIKEAKQESSLFLKTFFCWCLGQGKSTFYFRVSMLRILNSLQTWCFFFYIPVNGGSFFNWWERIINKDEVMRTFSPTCCSCSLTVIFHGEMLAKRAKTFDLILNGCHLSSVNRGSILTVKTCLNIICENNLSLWTKRLIFLTQHPLLVLQLRVLWKLGWTIPFVLTQQNVQCTRCSWRLWQDYIVGEM